MNFSQLRALKTEPTVSQSMPMALDERADPDDDVDDKAIARARAMPPPPPRAAPKARSRTTLGDVTPTIHVPAGETMVRNVVLTPAASRPVPLVDARAALPQENTVFGLDAYDQPSQQALSGTLGRAPGERTPSEATHSAALFVNYLVARTGPDGPPIRSTDTGGSNAIFIKEWLRAPPTRWMPASESPVSRRRLDATELDRAQFNELTRTPRPSLGDVPCSKGNKCGSLQIRNQHGARINTQPWTAMWYAHERDLFDGPDREAFRRELETRQCIYCEMLFAARMFITCASTATSVSASHNARSAVGWHVLVNIEGEFPITATIGPDAQYYNGLIGQVPLPKLNGWRVRPSSNSNCVEFESPTPAYPPPDNASTRDGERGF